MNLFLVVIATQFASCKAEEREKMLAEMDKESAKLPNPTYWDKISWCVVGMCFGAQVDPKVTLSPTLKTKCSNANLTQTETQGGDAEAI